MGFVLAVAACTGLGVWALTALNPSRTLSGEDWTRVAYSIGFLSLVSTSLLSRRLQLGQTVRYGLIWVGIAFVLLLAFSFRDELAVVGEHLRSELAPSTAVATGAHEMAVTAEGDGNFYVMGAVNGQPVRFLVDTGATDIVLSPADARRLGVDTAALVYGRAAETANGAGYGAPFKADSLSVGPVAFYDVPTIINQAPMSASLLGIAFLKRLDSFEVRGRKLYLRWRS